MLDIRNELAWSIRASRILHSFGFMPEPNPGDTMTDLKPSAEDGARNLSGPGEPSSARIQPATPIRPAQARVAQPVPIKPSTNGSATPLKPDQPRPVQTAPTKPAQPRPVQTAPV